MRFARAVSSTGQTACNYIATECRDCRDKSVSPPNPHLVRIFAAPSMRPAWRWRSTRGLSVSRYSCQSHAIQKCWTRAHVAARRTKVACAIRPTSQRHRSIGSGPMVGSVHRPRSWSRLDLLIWWKSAPS